MPGGYEDTVCDMCGGAMVEAEGFPVGEELLCESCYEESEPRDDEDEPLLDDEDEEVGDEYAHAGVDDDDDGFDDDDETW